MKKLILKTILGAAVVFTLTTGAQAQVSLNVNIGSQPAWGPSGYNHVDYYYLPDIESYYDVSTGQYIYQDNGRWIFANNLPSRYRGYDLYSGYKVVVNRPKPYLNYSRDRATYGKYKNWKGSRQPMLRESRNTNGNHTVNQGNTNRGNNGMNRENRNQGGQQNQMNNGQRSNQQLQGQDRSQGQINQQTQGQNRQHAQGGQQNGGGGRGQRP